MGGMIAAQQAADGGGSVSPLFVFAAVAGTVQYQPRLPFCFCFWSGHCALPGTTQVTVR
jgi:hypothetical protein